MPNINKLLDSPLAFATSAAGTFLAAVAWIDPLWQFVVSTSSIWFTTIAVSAGTIAPNVDWIPTELATNVLVGAALVFGGIQLKKLYDKAQERFEWLP